MEQENFGILLTLHEYITSNIQIHTHIIAALTFKMYYIKRTHNLLSDQHEKALCVGRLLFLRYIWHFLIFYQVIIYVYFMHTTTCIVVYMLFIYPTVFILKVLTKSYFFVRLCVCLYLIDIFQQVNTIRPTLTNNVLLEEDSQFVVRSTQKCTLCRTPVISMVRSNVSSQSKQFIQV